jgi:hypothetical protein
MTDTKEEVTKLYKDAFYIHLIRKGYSIRKAEKLMKQVFGG